MIPSQSINSLRDEFTKIVEAAALGKLIAGAKRTVPLPRVNLPAPKVV